MRKKAGLADDVPEREGENRKRAATGPPSHAPHVRAHPETLIETTVFQTYFEFEQKPETELTGKH